MSELEREMQRTPEKQAELQQAIYNTMQQQAKMEAQYQDMVQSYRIKSFFDDNLWTILLAIAVFLFLKRTMNKKKRKENWEERTKFMK